MNELRESVLLLNAAICLANHNHFREAETVIVAAKMLAPKGGQDSKAFWGLVTAIDSHTFYLMEVAKNTAKAKTNEIF